MTHRLFTALAVASLLLLTAHPADAKATDVRVVGDSLTVMAYPPGQVPTGWTVEAGFGWTMRASRPLLAQTAAPGATLIAALGTNDVAVNSSTMGPDVWWTSYLPGRCIIFTTVKRDGVTTWVPPADWAARADRWNRLVSRAAEAPRIVLADWNGLSRPHPGYFTADGLHLTPLGAEAYRWILADAAARCP